MTFPQAIIRTREAALVHNKMQILEMRDFIWRLTDGCECIIEECQPSVGDADRP